ncbi:DUF4129 domain-containing protein [Mycobacterium sp. 21AC1]|uniref:DUF4129 domain-containing protein n=1 Tax=[Mycobacterium] appelbergii TaxID=2939269 RepID=UPI002938E57B|nr:DUF4129 domain-containing protein [Mycobacterium sp. 21AC1]MDV3129624.1 DUF4129 domain-containing protein [Mycobacterium sp. 21AC1]
MPGIDKAAGRVAIVLVLLVVAAIALRGYLPGGAPAPARAPTDSPASVIAVIALLTVALAGFAFAVITAPRKAAAPGGDDNGILERRGLQVHLRWRWVVGALAVLLCWLFALVLIARLTAPPDPGVPASGAPASTPVPPPPGSTEPRPPEPTGSSHSAFGYLAAATVVTLLILALGTVVHARRTRAAAQPDDAVPAGRPAAPSRSETLVHATELGLAEIGDSSREPRAAIIACYAAMELGLAQAPGAVPQDSDTPSEVLARAVRHHALSPGSATELVELFTEARFSPHVMSEQHRDTAVAALHRVLADLRGVS